MELRGNYQKTIGKCRSFPQPKALVVDERPDSLEYYAAMLEAYGYQVRRCGVYCEGARCLGNEAFDFVIVSQETPRFEGSCVLKRAVEIDRGLPVIVVARCLDMGSYIEAMQLGATDYLVEPVTAWEIHRLLPPQPYQRAAA
jgi:two-component system KDP operon response regulator KdpE